MIDNLDNFLVGIAFGVRFRANFSIEDQLGCIVDDILYKQGTSFSPNLFPTVRSSVNGKQLLDEKSGNKLTIDNSNFILELNRDSQISNERMDELVIAFNNEIINSVMKKYHIREIRRIGYCRQYIFTISELAERFVDQTIGQTLGGVDDINLRFSKKVPSEKSVTIKDIDDYYNIIFNIIKYASKDEIFMSVDFQELYDPFLPTVAELKFDPFIRRAKGYNNDKYLPWLNQNYVEA